MNSNNNLEERKKKSIPFAIMKKDKMLRKNLNKMIKDLYCENYKIFKKKKREDTNKGQDILCHVLEELLLLKDPSTNLMLPLSKYPRYVSQN